MLKNSVPLNPPQNTFYPGMHMVCAFTPKLVSILTGMPLKKYIIIQSNDEYSKEDTNI